MSDYIFTNGELVRVDDGRLSHSFNEDDSSYFSHSLNASPSDYIFTNGELMRVSDADYLMHYGRKGMKWYQHIFSKAKTAAKNAKTKIGTKHELNKAKKQQAKAEAEKQEQKTNAEQPARKKKISEMTNEELRAATDRYNLEANYLSAKSRANPKQEKAKSFANQFVNDAVKPALINAGRTQMEKYLNKQVGKMLGNDEKDTIGDLRKQAEELGLKSKISTAKKVVAQNEDWLKERDQKQQEEKQKKDSKRITDERYMLEDKSAPLKKKRRFGRKK